MLSRPTLGAPGVYPLPDEPLRALTGVRMDVAAFVGIAPRGPARLPAFAAPWATPPRGPGAPLAPLRSVAVQVESWDAYRRVYGGFEGPGLLPYSVAAFFENGGRSAYVVRVVHDYGDAAADARGTASGTVPGVRTVDGAAVTLTARNEGSWGNRLAASISFRARPLAFLSVSQTGMIVSPDVREGVGTLLRVWLSAGVPALTFVTDVVDRWTPSAPVRERWLTFGTPPGAVPERVEVVEAALYVTDATDDGIGRAEVHEGVGLGAAHPRFLAAQLYRDSALVYPGAAWIGDDLLPDDPFLRTPAEAARPQFTCGRDRWSELATGDFFDPLWTPGDEEPGSGVHALAEVDEVGILVVPDLYSPGPLPERSDVSDVVSLAGPAFATCVQVAAPAVPDPDLSCLDGFPPDPIGAGLTGMALDPLLPSDLQTISTLQQALVEFTEGLERWVVLLDVPPGLGQRQVLDWRARFASPYAAAYHPWLNVARTDDARDALFAVNPSAFAAGIVAWQERAFGVQHGPANVLAVDPVSLTDSVSPARHDELHQSNVNVFLPERDGIRLTAGRTLSRDPQWRQLSVRRLITMLRRTLLVQMQWTVFEPNDAALREELTRMLEGYLRGLFQAGAFRGRTPGEGFFVQCDEELNPPAVTDQGRLVCHVGVAPVEPLEFILLRLVREGDGTLLTEG
jgi:hypothetical protein